MISEVVLRLFFLDFDDWPAARPADELEAPLLFLPAGPEEEEEDDDDARALAGTAAAFFLPARLLCVFFLPLAFDEALPFAGVRPAEEAEPPVSVAEEERALLAFLLVLPPLLGGGSGVLLAFSSTSPPDIRNAICWRSVILEKSMDPSSLRGRSAEDEGGRSSCEPRDEPRGIFCVIYLPGMKALAKSGRI